MSFLAEIEPRTCDGYELALERRLEAEFGAEAAMAAVVNEDVVRAERREAHAARVTALRLSAILQRETRAVQFRRRVKQRRWIVFMKRRLCSSQRRQIGARLGNRLHK